MNNATLKNRKTRLTKKETLQLRTKMLLRDVGVSDIAKHLNIHANTVTRYLTGHSVRQENANAIHQAIQELDKR